MARYRLVWLEIADRQYDELPADLRDVVDQRLARLVDDPTADRDAVYNARSDQWSVPLADEGFLFFAVVRNPPTLIILRLIYDLT
jgi:hypothetical protein